jgi:hypothetical protein
LLPRLPGWMRGNVHVLIHSNCLRALLTAAALFHGAWTNFANVRLAWSIRIIVRRSGEFLPALTSAVILGSESLGTHDHILPSHDFGSPGGSSWCKGLSRGVVLHFSTIAWASSPRYKVAWGTRMSIGNFVVH